MLWSILDVVVFGVDVMLNSFTNGMWIRKEFGVIYKKKKKKNANTPQKIYYNKYKIKKKKK